MTEALLANSPRSTAFFAIVVSCSNAKQCVAPEARAERRARVRARNGLPHASRLFASAFRRLIVKGRELRGVFIGHSTGEDASSPTSKREMGRHDSLSRSNRLRNAPSIGGLHASSQRTTNCRPRPKDDVRVSGSRAGTATGRIPVLQLPARRKFNDGPADSSQSRSANPLGPPRNAEATRSAPRESPPARSPVLPGQSPSDPPRHALDVS